MTYHPQPVPLCGIHVIVPAGGLTPLRIWKHTKCKGNFLFPVEVLSRLFRGKLLARMHALFKQGELNLTPDMRRNYYTIKNKLYKKEWVVYAKKKLLVDQIKYTNTWADIPTVFALAIIGLSI